MKNTMMNLIDAVRTFMALANQPGTDIRNLDVLSRVVEQRIAEALELIQKYPTEMDLIAVLGFLRVQLSATESMAAVIADLHGFAAAAEFVESMNMVSSGADKIREVSMCDEIAQAERAMNSQTQTY